MRYLAFFGSSAVLASLVSLRHTGADDGKLGIALLVSANAWPWACAAAAAAVVALYHIAFAPVLRRTKDYHNPRSSRYKALRGKLFPPGFPNGWHCVCNATDLEGGRVKSIDALGTHMVAFRGADGKVGVLHAFCPHLGAHLGCGGTVVGSTLRCPFHGWAFDASGACRDIPYTTAAVPERAKTRAYHVREILGRVYIWFDAEGRPPQWELAGHSALAAGVERGQFYLAAARTMEFEQHVCEMAMNSADPFHFQTLHAPFPLPGLDRVITGKHTIKQVYGRGLQNGAYAHAEHLSSITERTEGLFFFGSPSLPVPFSAAASARVHTAVTFEGPTVVDFTIQTPFGEMRQLKTILPIEPFKQFVESRWYAERSVPRVVAWFFSLIGARALEQDREVWENKMYRAKPLLVCGDGPFPAFMRWYGKFYSESSAAVGKHQLEW
eukprot:g2880.t1